MFYQKVEEYYDPIEILQKGIKSEMQAEQHAFLCGLIKEKRPKKILELGVSGGGTTCVILNCIHMLNLDTELISVDISEYYYQDRRKKTAYETEKINDELLSRHRLLTGKSISERIEEVAPEKDIDFLLLDTTHQMPGEVLDFLICLPFCKLNATVVLHDVVLNSIVNPLFGEFFYANKLLFDVVSGNKYWNASDYYKYDVSDIAAFDITNATYENIPAVFSALINPWFYIPDNVDCYREVLKQYYDKECVKLFDNALKSQEIKILCDELLDFYGKDKNYLSMVMEKIKKSDKLAIFGAGRFGSVWLKYMRLTGVGEKVAAILVSDQQNITAVIENVPIYHFSEIAYQPEEISIVMAVQNKKTRTIIEQNLRYEGYYKIV